jgi:tRNA A-37 threonylcarbamoyl transferase component Bud32
MRAAAGNVLNGRYQLVERIATGGMGEVWRAQDETLHRAVAVKLLKEGYADDRAFLERFRAEATHTAALAHPGVAGVFDYGEVDGTAYLVMELVDGEPLSSLLQRSAPLPTAQALDIVGQTGLALQAAHDLGVVHRDVKPGNILVRRDGVVKVTDFGVARAVSAASVTQTGFVVGTAAYLSPEQARGEQATPASDVYALGVVAYECLSGRRPFEADGAIGLAMAHASRAPAPLPADVPAVVADFVMRALDKDPAHRQPSAGDFGRTALALAAQLGSTAPAPAPATKLMPVEAPTPGPPGPPVAGAAAADVEAHRRRVRNAFVAIGAAVVVIGFFALRAAGSGGASPHVPVKHYVTVSPTAYIGEAAATARAQLRAKGLHVHTSSVVGGGPTGTVTRVTPTGRLLRGSSVVLTVAAAPPTPTPPAGPGPGPAHKPKPKPKHDHGEHGD